MQFDTTAAAIAEMRALREDLSRFLLQYSFGIQEITTKIAILQEEFEHTHDYNPIEHVTSRLKSPESLMDKIARRGVEPSLDAIRMQITDIAGVRITCSFVRDVYRLFDLLTSQGDIRVVSVKDYIAQPKANGYKSLHAILEVPVFLSVGEVAVPVEVQFRTIAMDFWASLEHKIYYKYDREVPAALLEELRTAALAAAHLDAKMENLHREIRGVPAITMGPPAPAAPAENSAALAAMIEMFRIEGATGTGRTEM